MKNKWEKVFVSKIVSCIFGYFFIIAIVCSFQNFSFGDGLKNLNTFYWLFFFVFLIFSFVTPLSIFKIYASIKNLLFEIKVGNLENKVVSKKSLGEIWKNYSRTFIKYSCDKSLIGKTRANADLYFSADEIANNSYWHFPLLEFIKLVPGTFIGLGILGTFMGFSQFLGSFIEGETNFDSFEIFDGLKIAFNTSIIGILSSIIYNFFIAQPVLSLMSKGATDLSDALDREYYVSDERCIQSLSSIVSGAEEVIKNNISQMVSEIQNVITEERHQFTEQVLGTADRLTEINNSLENIPKNIQMMDAELNKSIHLAKEKTEEQLNLSLSAIDEKISGIFGNFETIFATVQNKLSEIFSTLNSDVREMIRTETASSIESTNRLLSDTESRLMMTSDKIDSSVLAAISEAKTGFENLFRQSKGEMQEINALMEKAIDENNQKLSDSISSSANQLEILTEKLKNLTEKYVGAEETMAEISEKIVASEETFAKNTSEMKDIFVRLADTALLMKDSLQFFSDMRDCLKAFPEQQKEMCHLFNSAADEMRKTVILLANKTLEISTMESREPTQI